MKQNTPIHQNACRTMIAMPLIIHQSPASYEMDNFFCFPAFDHSNLFTGIDPVKIFYYNQTNWYYIKNALENE